MSSIHFQSGKIILPGAIATLDLTPGFRYVGPDDAEKILVDAWGNPPGNKTLGMIFPADVSPLQKNGWGVVVTYEKDGHVKDDDADSIKYDELLQSMQESEKTNNEERKKSGYAASNLMGWAEPPTYDKQSHKLFWAKNIRFSDTPENTLNYNIRVLGREGVLVLNAVAGMNQITEVKQQMQNVNAFSEFTPGNGYNDFNEKTDKVAEYGIAALVAGGIAAKLGLFGKLFALLIAFKKIILLGIAGVGSYIYKFFKGKKTETNAVNETASNSSNSTEQ
ncbi:DUF2167 domain-containing protein [Undibacterium sp. SXout11W]|uniref:DUF2167 domain-containing protein n=1 Tax=Undibacterium sp. SXout11W TaxID=3413050 RepID=UPI003BF26AFE